MKEQYFLDQQYKRESGLYLILIFICCLILLTSLY